MELTPISQVTGNPPAKPRDGSAPALEPQQAARQAPADNAGATRHPPHEDEVKLGEAPTSFEDALAATSQAWSCEGPYVMIEKPGGFSDLVVSGPIEIAFSQAPEIPVGRLGLDAPTKFAHAWRKPTLAEIAAEPNLHTRAWALLMNDVKGDTPEAIALLESVRDEDWLGLVAYHAGMMEPGTPNSRIINPKPKPKPRPGKLPVRLPSLFEMNWDFDVAQPPTEVTPPATEGSHDGQ